jgi:poly(A) polymerase Pap1
LASYALRAASSHRDLLQLSRTLEGIALRRIAYTATFRAAGEWHFGVCGVVFTAVEIAEICRVETAELTPTAVEAGHVVTTS